MPRRISEAVRQAATINILKGQKIGADMKRLKLEGQRFGRLVAIARAPNRGGRTSWTCLCNCGTHKDIGTDPLRSGRIRSCGCLMREEIARRSTTHGGTVGKRRKAEYRAWLHAKSRCYQPNDAKYPIYGGRGIRMCDEWLNDFAAFLDNVGPKPSPAHSIDRIDVNGHYEPGNCRWALPKVQMNNMRSNRMVRVDGRRMTARQAADKYGVSYKAFHVALKKGKEPSRVLRKMRARLHRHH